eukprot:TRINITY_DN1592_c1_g1_i1.p1 TRINITY_DN1592_c1_g1~~TRINITY_DN1592_c1_g1_i1.p1  ORF type:complete len:183 (+),score=28.75 TRINITY_DN1592_c1_g1_i1:362-910(+)
MVQVSLIQFFFLLFFIIIKNRPLQKVFHQILLFAQPTCNYHPADNYFMTSENISQSRFDAVEESLASIRRLSECMVNGIGNISENAPPSKEEREARSAEAAAALQEVFNGALSFIDSLPDERFEPDLPEYQKLLETAVSEHSEAAAALQQEIIKSSEVHKQAISKLKSEVETKYTAASTTTT